MFTFAKSTKMLHGGDGQGEKERQRKAGLNISTQMKRKL